MLMHIDFGFGGSYHHSILIYFLIIFAHKFKVNADFSDDAQVDRILNTWEELRPGANLSSHHKKGFNADDDNDDEGGQTGVTESKRAPIWKEIPIMFRRHIMLIIRDRK
jgi:hypothetical protein